ncbi:BRASSINOSTEROID INSENSITIVE 1-associated receptor kinase 1-like [Punica granatum]|uniref:BRASSINOSTEROID INSENSITIVE 1-associated receptor kinase 1-like n=2 Tax=Punica granatum TaxID=22663 RepID=A0A6P8CPE8_PUNGR|nr:BRASSINOSTEROID INSENSITIVE 1-associated receptor kinase 1-like [Punica granatum]PKI32610.1 hypothetical protein CRG98_047007 [Punica granatum]
MVFKFRTPSFSRNSSPDTGKRIPLSQLRVATHNFSPNNILGMGGFGSVYRGRLPGGSYVAVKRLSKHALHGLKQYNTEIEVADSGAARHPNLLPLLGYCSEGEERLLIYPLMANNDLASHLGRRSGTLDWAKRKGIAIGAARGLAHLHEGCSPAIIHRDVNSSNILLDRDFKPFLGDFGLARIMHEEDLVYGTIEWPDPNSSPSTYHRYKDTYVYTAVRGAMNSIALDYFFTGKCTQKSDVFAFGNLLLEIVTGKTDKRTTLVDWVRGVIDGGNWGRVVDPNLRGHYDEGEAKRLVQLGLVCSDINPELRPKMSQVVEMLEGETLGFYHQRSWGSNDSTPYYSFPPSPAEPARS